MKPISAARIAAAVSGEIAWGDENVQVDNVVIDSREAGRGSLFVPIVGERVDAHRFIPDVLGAGAAVTFSSNRDIQKEERGTCIFVEDTVAALQELAAWYRGCFSIPVVGITGSVGKTTTKEMVAAVLEQKYRTVKTIGNLNSQIGVALMMFHIDEDTEMAVIEMGISMPGEMKRLADIAKPSVAVMTNIGVSHIGNLGTRENICFEKGNIIRNFQDDGALYVCGNGDLMEMSKKVVPSVPCRGKCEIIYYGTDAAQLAGMAAWGDGIQPEKEGQSFVYRHGKLSGKVELAVLGGHNVNNAVAAIAVGERFGVPMDAAKRALSAYEPMAMRGVVKEAGGAHIIDDTYNASPDSVNSNIRALFEREGGRKIAVLGDVLELGERSGELHEGIGSFILEEAENGRKLSALVTTGKEAEAVGKVVSGGAGDIPVYHCSDNEAVVRTLKPLMKEGDWILVKGSRGMHMDEVVDRLAKE